jgi:hypothetical protein
MKTTWFLLKGPLGVNPIKKCNSHLNPKWAPCLKWFKVLKIVTYFCDSHVGILLKH